jgi:hypothetical protein
MFAYGRIGRGTRRIKRGKRRRRFVIRTRRRFERNTGVLRFAQNDNSYLTYVAVEYSRLSVLERSRYVFWVCERKDLLYRHACG